MKLSSHEHHYEHRHQDHPVPTLEIITMAFDSLRRHRLRSGLTMLGMIIGISSVIAITAIGQGVQKSTERKLQGLGTNLLMVMSGASTNRGISQGLGSSSTLTWEDAKTIGAEVLAAKAVTAFLQKPSVQVVYENQNTATTIIGTDLNYLSVKNMQLQTGSFFTQTDLDGARPVAVLGAKVQQQFFGNSGSDPLAATIRIQRQSYQVVGVLQAKGAVGNQDQDDAIYIPLTSMSRQIVGNNALSGTAITGLWLATTSSADLDAAQFQVTNLLRLRHNIQPPTADDFNLTNQVDIINTFSYIMNLLTLMMTAIAGISLIVGGIGIANIMLVSVVERTREIGIRKALGATNRTILYQFLIEALLLSMVGGSIGILLGVMIAVAAAVSFNIPLVIPFWSTLLGVSLSGTVGLLAGAVPARNAAQLDPITALRSE
jgi:putative ABC transport system permease protein